MSLYQWLIIAYALLLGYAMPYVVEFPAWLAARTLKRYERHARPLDRAVAFGGLFLLRAVGIGLWFLLWVAPIKYPKVMHHERLPTLSWLYVSLIVGVGLAALRGRWTRQE